MEEILFIRPSHSYEEHAYDPAATGSCYGGVSRIICGTRSKAWLPWPMGHGHGRWDYVAATKLSCDHIRAATAAQE